MKKYFISLIVCMFYAVNAFSVNIHDVMGVWQTDSVVITITEDSMYIDEIGNEGFGYSIYCDGDCIIGRNSVDEYFGTNSFVMHVAYVDKNVLCIKYDNDDTLYDFVKRN